MDATDGRELLSVPSWSQCVRFSPDGRLLATTNAVWDANTGEKRFDFPADLFSASVDSLAFSPDGRRLILNGTVDGALGHVMVLAVPSGERLLSFRATDGYVSAVDFSPDGLRFAVASQWDGKAHNEPTQTELSFWDGACGIEARQYGQHRLAVTDVAFSPDGRQIAAVSAMPRDGFLLESHPRVAGETTMWDVSREQELLSLAGSRDVPLAVSTDGRRIAAASFDDAVVIWDAATLQRVLTLVGHRGIVRDVAFRPDGKRIATVSDDKTVKVWDAESGRELLTLPGHKDAPTHVVFSPDGRKIVSTVGVQYRYSRRERNNGSNDPSGVPETRVWDATTGGELATIPESSCTAFSPDSKQVITAGKDGMRMWDAETGKEATLPPPADPWRSAHSFLWSADGRRIARGGPWEQEIVVWDAPTKRELFSTRDLLGGHPGSTDCRGPQSRRGASGVGGEGTRGYGTTKAALRP